MDNTHYSMQNQAILQTISIIPNNQNIHPNVTYIQVQTGAQLNILGNLYIDKVEHIDAVNTFNNSPHPKDQAKQEPDRNKRAVLAVHQHCSCNAADWAVVVKLLEEQGAFPKSAYQYAAAYINETCGVDVTSSKSLARSIIYTKVIGKYPNWRIKDEEVSRETPKKLHRFMEIAKVFIDSQND